ncbi:hypothetical protein BB560_006800, partial [Smittium megazygosporum]
FTLFISTNKVRMWPNGPPPIVERTFGPSNNQTMDFITNKTYHFIPIISRIDLEVVKDFVLSLLKDRNFCYQLAAAVGVSEVIYYLFFDPLRKIPGDTMSFSHALHKKYGPIARVGPNKVSVSSTKDLRYILSSYKYPKSKSYETPTLYKSQSMFTTTDEKYNRTRRRQVGPAFSTTGLASVEDLVLEHGILLLKAKIDYECKRNNVQYLMNYYSLFQSVAADIIGELAFGKTFEAVKNGGHDILGWVTIAMKANQLKQAFPILKAFPFLVPGMHDGHIKVVEFSNRHSSPLSNVYTDIAPDYYIAVFRDTVKISDASYTSHFEKINSYIVIRRSSDNPAKIDFVYKHFLNGYTGKFDHYLSSTSEDPQRLNILNKIKSFRSTPFKQMYLGVSPDSPAELNSQLLTRANTTIIQIVVLWDIAYIKDTDINTARVDFEEAIYGVAKKVKLVAVKVLDDSDSGPILASIKGIECQMTISLQQKEAMATGNPPPQGVLLISVFGSGRSESLNAAVNNAVVAGTTHIIATGNYKLDACNSSPSLCRYILSTWIGSNTATNIIPETSMATPYIRGHAVYFQTLYSWILTPVQIKNIIVTLAISNVAFNSGTGSSNIFAYNTLLHHSFFLRCLQLQ